MVQDTSSSPARSLASAAVASVGRTLPHSVEAEEYLLSCCLLDGADAKALREAMDKVKAKLKSCAVVLAAIAGDKITLIAGVSADLTAKVKAGELVNFVAQQVGGKGGGRPDMAQAGGNDPANLPAALAAVPSWVGERL